MATTGCCAFTPELRNIVWPSKFKPDLPPRYDGTADPAEFLQLYELSIKAASGDEKIMANWFPMALKDGARSWLLNLTEGSVSSWEEMRSRFIANFQGTRDRPPAAATWRDPAEVYPALQQRSPQDPQGVGRGHHFSVH